MYSELKQMDISRAVNEMAELVLPRFTENKIFAVSIVMDISTYDTKPSKSERREFTFVFYRPDNYMFVGLVNADHMRDDSPVEYLSHHDSCWREAVERKISEIAEEIEKKMEGVKEYHIFNHFGLFGTEVRNGSFRLNSDERTAKFVKPKKEVVK